MQHKHKEIKVLMGFSLWKYDFRKHPLQNEREVHRRTYAGILMTWLQQATHNHPVCMRLQEKIQTSLRITADDALQFPLSKLVQQFSNKIFWHGGLRFGWRDYRPLLLLEYAFCSWSLLGKMEDAIIYKYAEELKIDKSSVKFLFEQVPTIFSSESKITQAITASLSDDWTVGLSYIKQSLEKDYVFRTLPRYNVVICATMSSGKSTLINALWGTDKLPFCNQACTAKIVSLENDKNQSVMVGCNRVVGGHVDYYEIDSDLLNEWNNDTDITEINLVGRMAGVASNKSILRIYDTPGTNNAMDNAHAEMTKNFLLKEKPDLLIYVIDAEHPGTTDEASMLQWIDENMDNNESKLIFLVNKLDTIDTEQESMSDFMMHVKSNLNNLGFENVPILPISANAARLFRMALAGSELSRRDKLRLKELYQLFMEDGLDLRKFMDFSPSEHINFALAQTVLANNNEYKEWNLSEAIERTGITVFETLLQKKSEEAFM